MANPMSAIAPVAIHSFLEQRVPSVMFAAPTTASDAYAIKRLRIGPPNSTSTSIAKEPNAANVATCGLPITLSANANTAGITIAARAALRSATNPGSRIRSADCHVGTRTENVTRSAQCECGE
jgi:hypothetical protein